MTTGRHGRSTDDAANLVNDAMNIAGLVASRRTTRVHRLDAIRGLLALGVMWYHVADGPTVLGTYGVYAFFALSGFALEHVYGGRLRVRSFALARVARLVPLWVPVVLVSAVMAGIADPARILLNLTGVFGLVLPGQTSIVTGGWSIGIEGCCYVLFPALTRVGTRGLFGLAGLLLILRWVWMPPDYAAGWVQYTQLPSFLVFFVLGMGLARVGDRGSWSGWPARVASLLGDASYGVYLLHPLVAVAVGPWALLLTPPLALAVHRLYEVPAGRGLRRLREVDLLDVRVARGSRGLHRVDDQPVA